MKSYDFASTAKQQAVGIVGPALSPDGKQVAFVALNQLWLMTIGHKPRTLTHGQFYKADPTWSPDGRSLAYSTDSDGSMAIFIRNMRTGKTRKLTAPFTGPEVQLAWSPDGKKIAFLDTLDLEAGAREMYVADVATGQFQKVWGAANS